MKQVYHIRIAMGPSDSGETASERIYQTLHSMGDFIKDFAKFWEILGNFVLGIF